MTDEQIRLVLRRIRVRARDQLVLPFPDHGADDALRLIFRWADQALGGSGNLPEK